MKIKVLMFLMFLVAGSSGAAAQVQYSPTLDAYLSSSGGVFFDRSSAFLDSMIQGQLQNQEMQRLMFNQVMIDQMIKEAAGKKKIAAGRANTRFAATPNNSLAERLAANGKSAAEKQEIKQSVALALAAFSDALKRKNLNLNDTADEETLSFVLCYLAYHNQDPGDARIQKLRKSLRNQLLSNPAEQGSTDADKQLASEKRAFQTMLAVRAYQQSQRPGISGGEKQAAQAAAKKYAAIVMKPFWDGSIAEIRLSDTSNSGFAGSDKKAVGEIGAATVFVRSGSLLTANELARFYDVSPQTVNSLIRDFDAELTRRGGAVNDAAAVNALSFAICYSIYTDGRVNLNRRQFEWVTNAMRQDLMNWSDFQNMSDEEKQKYCENVAAKAMVIKQRDQQPYMSAGAKTLAADRVALLFKDGGIKAYTLTPTGFTKK